MAAVVRADYVSGASGSETYTSAETGAKFNREETVAGTTAPIPKPTATGTAFSYPKVFRLNVTTLDAATSISNFRHRVTAASPATGLNLWYKDLGATYSRGNAVAAADAGTDGATPATYSAAPATDTQYDAGSYSAGTTGGKGDFLAYALGVSSTYAGGAGSSVSCGTLYLTYDEA